MRRISISPCPLAMASFCSAADSGPVRVRTSGQRMWGKTLDKISAGHTHPDEAAPSHCHREPEQFRVWKSEQMTTTDLTTILQALAQQTCIGITGLLPARPSATLSTRPHRETLCIQHGSWLHAHLTTLSPSSYTADHFFSREGHNAR